MVASGLTGVVRYIGPAKFATGDWVGIELDGPEGKNDGTVNGERVRAASPAAPCLNCSRDFHRWVGCVAVLFLSSQPRPVCEEGVCEACAR